MAETGSYIPPQSPIAIQPGDKGFEIVGKGYNRWLWTFPDWKKGKKKIIDPNANWGLNAKPMSQDEINKKMKGLYLTEVFQNKIEESMKHVVNFDSFLNEGKIFEADTIGKETEPVKLGSINISVVKTQQKKGTDPETKQPIYKTINGAVRFSAPGKKPIDYKIDIAITFGYEGAVVPSNLKYEQGKGYIITTNVGQQETIKGTDMSKVITAYKQGKNEIEIPGMVADLKFKRTWDFQDVK